MRRYMWPNSALPSATTLINAAYTATGGRFTLESVENHSARKCPRLYLASTDEIEQTILALFANGAEGSRPT